MVKFCVLKESKICNDCGECNICDLDKNKLCDNCGKCLENNEPFSSIYLDSTKEDFYFEKFPGLLLKNNERYYKTFKTKEKVKLSKAKKISFI